MKTGLEKLWLAQRYKGRQRIRGSSGFPVKESSRQRPSAATPQPNQESLFHHRDTEIAEFGVFFNKKILYSAPSAPPWLAIRKPEEPIS